MPSDWKAYETEIVELFKQEYPEAHIVPNQMREGRFSKTMRQIDIWIEGQIAGNCFSVVVDAKFYNRKVDVKCVDSFISMVHDIGAHKGLIITQKGYSDAAIARAFNDPHDIELDILSFEELREFQGLCAIPYAGEIAAVIRSPFGWVIDATQYERPSGRAHIYQRGSNIHDAFARGEIMYVQFWDRKKDGLDLEALTALQEKRMKSSFPDITIEYLPTINRNDGQTRLRQAIIPKYADIREYTGFIQFEEFIFFVVLLTPHNLAKRNVRKLESVMLSALPMHVKNKATPKSDADQKNTNSVQIISEKEYGWRDG